MRELVDGRAAGSSLTCPPGSDDFFEKARKGHVCAPRAVRQGEEWQRTTSSGAQSSSSGQFVRERTCLSRRGSAEQFVVVDDFEDKSSDVEHAASEEVTDTTRDLMHFRITLAELTTRVDRVAQSAQAAANTATVVERQVALFRESLEEPSRTHGRSQLLAPQPAGPAATASQQAACSGSRFAALTDEVDVRPQTMLLEELSRRVSRLAEELSLERKERSSAAALGTAVCEAVARTDGRVDEMFRMFVDLRSEVKENIASAPQPLPPAGLGRPAAPCNLVRCASGSASPPLDNESSVAAAAQPIPVRVYAPVEPVTRSEPVELSTMLSSQRVELSTMLSSRSSRSSGRPSSRVAARGARSPWSTPSGPTHAGEALHGNLKEALTKLEGALAGFGSPAAADQSSATEDVAGILCPGSLGAQLQAVVEQLKSPSPSHGGRSSPFRSPLSHPRGRDVSKERLQSPSRTPLVQRPLIRLQSAPTFTKSTRSSSPRRYARAASPHRASGVHFHSSPGIAPANSRTSPVGSPSPMQRAVQPERSSSVHGHSSPGIAPANSRPSPVGSPSMMQRAVQPERSLMLLGGSVRHTMPAKSQSLWRKPVPVIQQPSATTVVRTVLQGWPEAER